MADFDQELDATGLNCPLPILRAKKALGGMSAGQVLHIIATDPGSVKDFEAFAKQTGNELMESKEEGGKFLFLIKKSLSNQAFFCHMLCVFKYGEQTCLTRN